MKILFFTHYFPPEGNAPASRTYEHCRRWVEAGHDVTVVTCVPNVPNGIPYPGFKNRIGSQHEDVDGIKVIRVWTYLAPNAGFTKRTLNYISYMFVAVFTALFLPRPDIIVATSPQFFCGWAGVITKAIKRRPFVLEIRDIWPESITAVGAMRRGWGIRMLEWLERKMYKTADHIVAVGQGYADNIDSKVPCRHKTTVIYNGVDGGAFRPQEKDKDWLRKWGMDGKFVCAYVGTIGMAHGLETVIQAAELLRREDRQDIGFLLVGDGARRSTLERDVEAKSLTDAVRFTGRLDKSEMPAVTASADALLVHLKACDLFETVIPSKIFEAMAMERPIIMGVRGESAGIVRRAESGIEMEPGNSEDLCRAVKRLADDSELYSKLSGNGRGFVLQEFSRDKFADEFLQVMISILGGGVPKRSAAEIEQDTAAGSG